VIEGHWSGTTSGTKCQPESGVRERVDDLMGREAAMTRTAKFSILAALAAILGGCGGPDSAGAKGSGDVVRIGAYSVVKEAFHDGLIPAFAKRWKAKTGRDVTFEESYNGSGAQARAIKQGQPADVAVLSLEDDMELLAKAGIVKSDWNAGPNKGMLTNSLVVIGHRDGNPKALADWSDLAKPGVVVLYPDPMTSGGAKWNVSAIYGATKPPGELIAKVQKNVANMDASGRQSVATFERGVGDAVVTYENELLLRKKTGKAIPYVIPERTLLIESPVALVDANVEKHGNREVAEAFLAFLLSAEGQTILADYGFRPIDPSVPDKTGRPLPKGVFRIADLGGWKAVNVEVFGKQGVWKKSLMDGQ
jgi:sulfate/thiosulfate transport system substrate-binding protein